MDGLQKDLYSLSVTHRGSKRSGSDPEGSDRMLPRVVSAMWHDRNSNNTKICIIFVPNFAINPGVMVAHTNNGFDVTRATMSLMFTSLH